MTCPSPVALLVLQSPLLAFLVVYTNTQSTLGFWNAPCRQLSDLTDIHPFTFLISWRRWKQCVLTALLRNWRADDVQTGVPMCITRFVLLSCWCEHLVSYVLRNLDWYVSKCYNVKMFYPFPPKLVSCLELPSIHNVTFVETLSCIYKSVAQRCLCRGAEIGISVINRLLRP